MCQIFLRHSSLSCERAEESVGIRYVKWGVYGS